MPGGVGVLPHFVRDVICLAQSYRAFACRQSPADSDDDSEPTAVKLVVAIVKPYLVEKVLEGLKRAPLEAVSVREVKGFGRQKSYLDQYAGSEYSQAFLPKVEINLWVDDARVEEITRRIVEVARTGRMGDGKIFVMPAVPSERVIEIGKSQE